MHRPWSFLALWDRSEASLGVEGDLEGRFDDSSSGIRNTTQAPGELRHVNEDLASCYEHSVSNVLEGWTLLGDIGPVSRRIPRPYL